MNSPMPDYSNCLPEQIVRTAYHELGHVFAAIYCGVTEWGAKMKPGSDQRGKWDGRFFMSPEALSELTPHQRRIIGVAGATAVVAMLGLDEREIEKGMSPPDWNGEAPIFNDEWAEAAKEVLALLTHPGILPVYLRGVERFIKTGELSHMP